MEKDINWLITGGCGFIGSMLIKELAAEGGHNIRVFDNLSVGKREDLSAVCDYTEISIAEVATMRREMDTQVEASLHQEKTISYPTKGKTSVELIVGDIRNDEVCHKAAKGADVIVHLAASTGVGPSVEDPSNDMSNNVIGTINMLEAARQCNVKRFVFASSGGAVGECEPPIHEEIAPRPVSPYGAGKLTGEGYCSAYFRTFGIKTIMLRFGNVYGIGSGRKNSVIAKFIKQALSGNKLEIYGDGTQTRDFIFINDLISAIRKAVNPSGISLMPSDSSLPSYQPPWGEVFQIATNRETTVEEMVNILISILKGNGIKDVTIVHGERRSGDVMRNFSDTTKAKKILGWQAKMGLQEGLERTVSWFLAQEQDR